MSLESIITALDIEMEKLREVRALLSGTGTPKTEATTSASPKRRGKRRLSPEARKRIADAQRKRWAAVAAAKNATPSVSAAKAKKAVAVKSVPAKKSPAKGGKKAPKKAAVHKANSAKAKKAIPKSEKAAERVLPSTTSTETATS